MNSKKEAMIEIYILIMILIALLSHIMPLFLSYPTGNPLWIDMLYIFNYILIIWYVMNSEFKSPKKKWEK